MRDAWLAHGLGIQAREKLRTGASDGLILRFRSRKARTLDGGPGTWIGFPPEKVRTFGLVP